MDLIRKDTQRVKEDVDDGKSLKAAPTWGSSRAVMAGSQRVKPRIGPQYQASVPDYRLDLEQSPETDSEEEDSEALYANGLPFLPITHIPYLHPVLHNSNRQEQLEPKQERIKRVGSGESSTDFSNDATIVEAKPQGTKKRKRRGSRWGRLGKVSKKIQFEAGRTDATKGPMSRPKNDLSDGAFQTSGVLVPGERPAVWSDNEMSAFVLGLHLFGKELCAVKRFMKSKEMKDVVHYYYGQFYRSLGFLRWSSTKNSQSRKCVHGARVVSGWRQQELLYRMNAHLSDFDKQQILAAANAFNAEETSLEEFVTGIKHLAGLELLVQCVGVGSPKQDLTAVHVDRCGGRIEIPAGKACSSLSQEGIVKFLTGDFRISKMRASDLFWEAVWPRLLTREWYNEDLESPSPLGPKNSLRFFHPSSVKLNDSDLEKGEHYFDSVSEVLNLVAADPSLLDPPESDDEDVEGRESKEQLPLQPNNTVSTDGVGDASKSLNENVGEKTLVNKMKCSLSNAEATRSRLPKKFGIDSLVEDTPYDYCETSSGENENVALNVQQGCSFDSSKSQSIRLVQNVGKGEPMQLQPAGSSSVGDVRETSNVMNENGVLEIEHIDPSEVDDSNLFQENGSEKSLPLHHPDPSLSSNSFRPSTLYNNQTEQLSDAQLTFYTESPDQEGVFEIQSPIRKATVQLRHESLTRGACAATSGSLNDKIGVQELGMEQSFQFHNLEMEAKGLAWTHKNEKWLKVPLASAVSSADIQLNSQSLDEVKQVVVSIVKKDCLADHSAKEPGSSMEGLETDCDIYLGKLLRSACNLQEAPACSKVIAKVEPNHSLEQVSEREYCKVITKLDEKLVRRQLTGSQLGQSTPCSREFGIRFNPIIERPLVSRFDKVARFSVPENPVDMQRSSFFQSIPSCTSSHLQISSLEKDILLSRVLLLQGFRNHASPASLVTKEVSSKAICNDVALESNILLNSPVPRAEELQISRIPGLCANKKRRSVWSIVEKTGGELLQEGVITCIPPHTDVSKVGSEMRSLVPHKRVRLLEIPAMEKSQSSQVSSPTFVLGQDGDIGASCTDSTCELSKGEVLASSHIVDRETGSQMNLPALSDQAWSVDVRSMRGRVSRTSYPLLNAKVLGQGQLDEAYYADSISQALENKTFAAQEGADSHASSKVTDTAVNCFMQSNYSSDGMGSTERHDLNLSAIVCNPTKSCIENERTFEEKVQLCVGMAIDVEGEAETGELSEPAHVTPLLGPQNWPIKPLATKGWEVDKDSKDSLSLALQSLQVFRKTYVRSEKIGKKGTVWATKPFAQNVSITITSPERCTVFEAKPSEVLSMEFKPGDVASVESATKLNVGIKRKRTGMLRRRRKYVLRQDGSEEAEEDLLLECSPSQLEWKHPVRSCGLEMSQCSVVSAGRNAQTVATRRACIQSFYEEVGTSTGLRQHQPEVSRSSKARTGKPSQQEKQPGGKCEAVCAKKPRRDVWFAPQIGSAKARVKVPSLNKLKASVQRQRCNVC